MTMTRKIVGIVLVILAFALSFANRNLYADSPPEPQASHQKSDNPTRISSPNEIIHMYTGQNEVRLTLLSEFAKRLSRGNLIWCEGIHRHECEYATGVIIHDNDVLASIIHLVDNSVRIVLVEAKYPSKFYLDAVGVLRINWDITLQQLRNFLHLE